MHGEKLRAFRKEKGWTITELARRAGLHRVTVSNIERGRIKNISLKNALKLCEALGCRPEDL